ncbi:zinc-binding dehydrogenase [Mycobacterium sp. MMS18-G62]
MKAMIVRELGARFVLEDVDVASPVGREVLVEVKASGLCHTDLTFSKAHFGPSPPFLLGHEVAGIVAAVGPGVTELSVGDHVVGCLVQTCGKCESCVTGRTFLCLHPEETLRASGEAPRLTIGGESVDQGFGLGGFAQKALVHENQLVKVNDKIPFPQAALLGCCVVTGAGSVLNSANTQAGDSVVIIGAGGVGLSAVNGAQIAGATTIIVVDIFDETLEKARRFGATHTINSTSVDAVAEVTAITGRGADAVFDFVGLPAVTRSALKMVRPGGGLYLIGALDPTATITLSGLSLIFSQKRVHGVYMGSTTPKRDIPLYADLYLQGRFNLDDLISRTIPLDAVNEGYELIHEPDVTRVVITSGL